MTYLLADVIIDHLKERLTEEWHHFDQNIIVRAVNPWRGRMRKIVNVSKRKGDTY